MLFRCRFSVTTAALALAVVLLPAPAEAAGFAIFEQGARGMGFAGAFTAQANDPSAIFHNAAGIAFLKGNQLYVGMTAINPKTDFVGEAPFPGPNVTEQSDVGILPPPALYYSHAFSDRLALGIGIHSPFGLKTQWANRDTTYTGRFISQQAELNGAGPGGGIGSINPTVAYKVADRLAVGFGVDVRFSKVRLDRRAASFDPFSFRAVDIAQVDLESDVGTGVGFNVGVLAKPSESVSIGIAYRHKVKIDYTGAATFTPVSTGNAQLDAAAARSLPQGPLPLTTALEFPAFASVGLAYVWNDWTVEGDVNWYQWSSFDQLRLEFTTRPELTEVIAELYDDSFQYRFGIERKLGDTWSVRGGYFFDASPSPAASVSPLLPDADRNGACLGASYQRAHFRIDAGSWYVFGGERSTEGQNRDRYDGRYKSSAFTFGVSVGYSF